MISMARSEVRADAYAGKAGAKGCGSNVIRNFIVLPEFSRSVLPAQRPLGGWCDSSARGRLKVRCPSPNEACRGGRNEGADRSSKDPYDAGVVYGGRHFLGSWLLRPVLAVAVAWVRVAADFSRIAPDGGKKTMISPSIRVS